MAISKSFDAIIRFILEKISLLFLHVDLKRAKKNYGTGF
jgi:hypothetical protein